MIVRRGSDATVCRDIVRRHARTFTWASVLLPAEKRRGAFAVYATCRAADDIVDVGPADQATSRLQAFRTRVESSLDTGADDPVLRELAWARERFDLPMPALWELFSGVERDLQHSPYASWTDLLGYCEAVAGTVGEMMAAVLGLSPDADPTTTIRHARKLGVAMQLTNILRDVGEDARRGRCYLPLEELRRFDLDEGRVLCADLRPWWPAWREFMAFQVERARTLYRQAAVGIQALAPDARRCALSCAAGYAGILHAIERADYDTLTTRVAATRADRLRVAWDSLLLRPHAFGASENGRYSATIQDAAR